MSKIDVERLRPELEKIVDSLGFELAEVSAPVVGGRLILRLFVHSPDGVTLDDCAKISREISGRLDDEDPISGRYTLEVSSLGLDRPLLTAMDFKRRIGEKVRISFSDNGGNSSVTGTLKKIDDSFIEIQKGEESITVPLNSNPRGKIII